MIKSSYLSKCLLLLGSGELGKEIVIESQRLGFKIIAVDKYPNAPAMHVADESYVIDMSDKESLMNLIYKIKPDFVIPEIESLSIEALNEMEKNGVRIIPNARTIEMTMNRDKIRDLASSELKIRTANYRYVFDPQYLKNSALEIGFPLLLKPLMSSSGKGQKLLTKEVELSEAWIASLESSRGNVKGVILEEFIEFDYEFTLLAVRTRKGENIFCLPIGHEQINGDYQCSWQPLEVDSAIFDQAKIISAKILNNLNGAGLYGVEFFVKGNELIFSELSPRPHDTGLVTILSQNINEFELHLRALLNLPIPEISLLNPAASRVILSDKAYETFFFDGIEEALKVKNSKILIFGKPLARKGRRMGVALATAQNVNEARLKADQCANRVKISSMDNS